MNTTIYQWANPNVQEFLALEPFVNAKILAGWSGKHNLIKEICKLEAFSELVQLKLNIEESDGDSTPPDSNPTSLVILILPDLPNNLSEILFSLLKHSLAGLILIGPSVPDFPLPLIDLANQKELPILFLDSEFASVDFELHWELICKLKTNDNFLSIVKNSYYELFLQKSKTQLLELLEQLVNNPVLIFNKAWQPVDWNTEYNTFFDDHDRAKFLEKIVRKSKTTRLTPKKDGLTTVYNSLTVNQKTYDYLIIPLSFKNYLFGYLIALETNAKFTSLDMVLLKQGALVSLQELITTKKIEDIEVKYKDEFIYDLLHFNFESETELRNRGKLWELDLSLPHHLLVLKLITKDSKHQISDLAANVQTIVNKIIASKHSKPVVTEIHDSLTIIFAIEQLEESHKFKQNIRDLGKAIHSKIQKDFTKTSVTIGIGKFYKNVIDLGKSFQEAKTALELSRFLEKDDHITFFEDLGVIRLLANVSYQQLEEYHKEYLATLIDYDLKNKTNFEETLQVYFQKNGDINATAEELFLHPNTLRYRLKKIEEITNSDLQKLEDQINLSIACKIAKMSSQP